MEMHEEVLTLSEVQLRCVLKDEESLERASQSPLLLSVTACSCWKMLWFKI